MIGASLSGQEAQQRVDSGRPLGTYTARGLELKSQDFSQLEVGAKVTALQFSHNGTLLAAAAGDQVFVWKTGAAEEPTSRVVLRGDPPAKVLSLAFSPDDRWLAAGGAEARVWQWDLDTGQQIGRQLSEDSAASISWLAYDADSLVVADHRRDDRTFAFVHRLAVGTLEPMPSWPKAYMPDAVAFSTDGRFCARVRGERLTVWDLRSRMPTPLSLPTHEKDVYAFYPDGATPYSDEGRHLYLAGPDWNGKTSEEKKFEALARAEENNGEPTPDPDDEVPWPTRDGGKWALRIETGTKQRMGQSDDRHVDRALFSPRGEFRLHDYGPAGVDIEVQGYRDAHIPSRFILPGDSNGAPLAIADGEVPQIARGAGETAVEYWYRFIGPEHSRPYSTKGAAARYNPAPSVRPEAEDYVTCTVFYGTNRRPRESTGQIWLDEILVFFQRDLGIILIALAVMMLTVSVLVMLVFRFFTWRRAGGLTALLVALVVGVPCAQAVVVMFKDKASPAAYYGNKRGELLYGSCEVTIPNSHQTGELETPLLVLTADPSKHIVLRNVDPVNGRIFLERLWHEARDREAFVFIHGYNVAFEDAARRTAQMAYDLEFPGVPLFFSWPSKANLLGYVEDANNSDLSGVQLSQFLTDIERHSGATRIHLIAHSMGTRVLSNALRDMGREKLDNSRFREIILAAPDIDAEYFKRSIAPAIVPRNPADPESRHVTLYASSKDRALEISKRVNGYPRAGDAGDREQLLLYPGLDTIDVSDYPTELTGHSYYGGLPDLFELLKSQRDPEQRKAAQQRGSLEFHDDRELPYWRHKSDG